MKHEKQSFNLRDSEPFESLPVEAKVDRLKRELLELRYSTNSLWRLSRISLRPSATRRDCLS